MEDRDYEKGEGNESNGVQYDDGKEGKWITQKVRVKGGRTKCSFARKKRSGIEAKE